MISVAALDVVGRQASGLQNSLHPQEAGGSVCRHGFSWPGPRADECLTLFNAAVRRVGNGRFLQ